MTVRARTAMERTGLVVVPVPRYGSRPRWMSAGVVACELFGMALGFYVCFVFFVGAFGFLEDAVQVFALESCHMLGLF